MDPGGDPGISADEPTHEDSVLEQIPQENYAEPVKKGSGHNFIRCDICCCDMSSTAVLNSHMNGLRHRKKMKALEIVANLRALGPKGVDVGSTISQNSYRCDLCCLTVNSPQQLQVHLSGSKHKNKVAKEKSLKFSCMTNMKSVPDNEAPLLDSPGSPVKKKRKCEQTFTCNVCNILLNSESQYEQHVYSKKHLIRSKGKKPARKRGGLRKKPNFPPSSTSGNQSRTIEEFDGDNRNGNASSIIQVQSPGNHINTNVSNSQSEGGNDDDCKEKHFLSNQQSGGECVDVDPDEVEKFRNKVESNTHNSD